MFSTSSGMVMLGMEEPRNAWYPIDRSVRGSMMVCMELLFEKAFSGIVCIFVLLKSNFVRLGRWASVYVSEDDEFVSSFKFPITVNSVMDDLS